MRGRGRLMKGRNIHVFSGTGQGFFWEFFSLLVWFFLAITMATVSCHSTVGDVVIKHANGIALKLEVVSWSL
jgi:hypothetical protein